MRYRVFWLIIGLGLALLGNEAAAQAQYRSAAGRDDTIKGAVWTATAKRIWADRKLAFKRPEPWPSGIAFKAWLDRSPTADKSGLGLLYGYVINRIGNGQPATAPEVAQAILAEVQQEQRGAKAWLNDLNEQKLHADLARLTSLPAPGTSPKTTAPASDTPKAVTLPGTPATQPGDTPSQGVAYSDAFNPNAQPRIVTKTAYLEQHPHQANALYAVLGVLVGAGFCWWWLSRAQLDVKQPEKSEQPDNQSSAESETQLRQENDDLKKRIDDLLFRLAAYEKRNTPIVSPTPSLAAELSPAPLVMPEVVAASELAPAPPAPAASPHRYGPVQETDFIEERKTVTTPLPQLALMLTPDPGNPDRASFTLNPHVNQTMLINDGLNRLQKFFDYDAPVGRITAVMAAAEGQLQRQAEGWKVIARARLLVKTAT